jgi:MtN3 and saliva related transmembrane protein
MKSEWVGMIAGLISCTTFLPQVIKTWKTKSVADVSPTMFVVATIGTFLWLIYGILIDSLPVILTNIVVLAFSLMMLVLLYVFRKKQ